MTEQRAVKNVPTLFFGEGKIGSTLAQNDRGVSILFSYVEDGGGKIGEYTGSEDIFANAELAFTFSNIESLDSVIHQLTVMKTFFEGEKNEN